MRYDFLPSQSGNNEVCIVLPNHLASSLDDATGDRAQYVHERFQMPVIPYERPSTATLDQLPAFNVDSYLEDVELRARKLQAIIHDLGIKKMIICGNSAGALDALAVAASGQASIERVVAIEPVAMRSVPATYGLPYFKSQMRKDKTEIYSDEFRDLEPLGDIRPKASGGTLKEYRAYADMYRSNLSVVSLRTLAGNYPNIPVNLVLGDKSKATTPKLRRSLIDEFADSSVQIDMLPASHSFPDRHHYLLHILGKAIKGIPIMSGKEIQHPLRVS